MDISVLLYDELSEAQIASYVAAVDKFLPESLLAKYTGTSTGANRVDLCRGIILRGVVGKNGDKIKVAVDALSPVFPYVTTGDGFYDDGSFVQHTSIPYIGGYGAVLNDGLGRLFALLRGSSWEVTDPGSQQFLDTIEAAIAPFVYNGLMMDNVSGRGITRIGTDDHIRAHGVMGSIVLLGQGASPEENARWRAMVKGWLQRDYYGPALKNPGLSLVNLTRLQTLLDDTTVTAAPEPVAHRVFHNMDRVTHRRRDWGAGLSLASNRIAHYEFGNLENYRGWHTGSGWLQWWGADNGLGQYSDAYWPTVNPYRIPGTTVSTKKLADGQGGAWANPVPTPPGWAARATASTAPPASICRVSPRPCTPRSPGSGWTTRWSAWARASPRPTARPSRPSSTTATWARPAPPPCSSTAYPSRPRRAGRPPAAAPIGRICPATPAMSSRAVRS